MDSFTLFTIPRAFQGKHAIIQENAIGSWLRLIPEPEIILFCDDPGVEETAQKLGCHYVPEVNRSLWGVPLVYDAFRIAQEMAHNDLMCYVNCDIVLTQKFVRALFDIGSQLKQFLMIGKRYDYPIKTRLDFSEGWQRRLKEKVKAKGSLHPAYGIDYFGFRRGMYGNMPPFAVGRAAWDNWLVWFPLRKGIPVVDVTPYYVCVHLGRQISKPKGDPEREYNRTLVPKNKRATIDSATWHYTKKGLVKGCLQQT